MDTKNHVGYGVKSPKTAFDGAIIGPMSWTQAMKVMDACCKEVTGENRRAFTDACVMDFASDSGLDLDAYYAQCGDLRTDDAWFIDAMEGHGIEMVALVEEGHGLCALQGHFLWQARKAEQEARRGVQQLADEAVRAVDPSALTMRPETLFGAFVTALEGGIGYWSSARVYRWKGADGEEDHTGFCAVIEIEDEDEDDLRTITAPVIEAGYLAIVERRVKVCDSIYKAIVLGWADVDGGGYVDADAADCIVQAGLFGEVVYG
jgi:hypothetical protein